MDFSRQFIYDNEDIVRDLKHDIESRLRSYWDALTWFFGELFKARLPDDWREQWHAVVAEQARRGYITDPQSVRDVEEYIAAWAKYCELEPKEEPAVTKQPTFIPAKLKKVSKPRSGHRPGRRYVSPKEAFFLQKLARAQRNLDEIGQVLESFGSQLDALKRDEEVDATTAVDRVDELIWNYNNEIESARDAWLRDNLSGELNNRLLSMHTPLTYGFPLYTDETQERRAMLQGMQVSRRLQGRNAVMDRIVTTMETLETAGDVAGLALGGGALVKIAKQGGKWAVVKTLAAGAAKEAVGRAAERAIEEAGVDQNTIGGAKLATALIRIILRKRISAARSTDAQPKMPPPPQAHEGTTPPPPPPKSAPKARPKPSSRKRPKARKKLDKNRSDPSKPRVPSSKPAPSPEELVRSSNPSRVAFRGMEVRAVRDLSHLDEGTLKRMRIDGFAARDINGRQLQLHHLNQSASGPLVEIPKPRHSISNRVQHPLGSTPGSGLTTEQRAGFNDWRENYWRVRAAEELQKRGIQ